MVFVHGDKMFNIFSVTNIYHHERLKMKEKQIWRVILSTSTPAVQSQKSSSAPKKKSNNKR